MILAFYQACMGGGGGGGRKHNYFFMGGGGGVGNTVMKIKNRRHNCLQRERVLTPFSLS
jgi:hypothetical protein